MYASLLIADADSKLSQLYVQFFSEFGFEVETASDGLECLDKLRQFKPHVLILDLDMPWGGGDGVLARMREDADLPRVPVVLVTGDSPPLDLAERSRVPAVCCFQKPFRLGALLDRLRSTASRNRFQMSSDSEDRPSPVGVGWKET